MRSDRPRRLLFPWIAILCVPLIIVLLLAALPHAPQAAQAQDVQAPSAPCDGGPTIDGVTLDECVVNDFSLGGDDVSITVWYTKQTDTVTRTLGDGSTITLTHWINNDSEAQDVADWAQESWEVYYEIFDRHPYIDGCDDNIDIRLEDLASGAGVAYWASSGSCRIGIDSPVVRAGNAQRTTYHEIQHYLQYAYDDGCYNDIRSNYDDNAEFVEGYADLAEDSVNAAVDAVATGGRVSGYDPTGSLHDKGYMNVFTKYFVEQAGQMWTPAEPHHGWDAVEAHYDECDNQDTLYVLNTVIPALTGGELNKETLFLNFFAANWAKDWADHDTQSELVYYDDDGNWYGDIALQQDVAISGGASWGNESTPDDWAGQYYQITPEPICQYVTVEVDGEAGARLGINLMAADIFAPSVSRSAWIGEDLTRTFPAAGVHQRIVAAVNAFDDTYDYDVSFTCVTPTVELLEPKPRPNSALVGDPDSPTAMLARFKVTEGDLPVRGLPESSFTANAEGDALSFVPNTFQEVGDEYWVVMTPPTKDPGTTYVDMEVCLDGATCDTNNDALLYVPPGNSDLAMVFDASGSMSIEDVAGEGSRVENAKKAGTVMADLLQDGDRVIVSDFSAHSCSPPDDCTLDINVYLERSEIPTEASIADARDAVDQVSARAFTPIGAALVDAKDRLLAPPAGENPKHIVLLSDGEENVNPLYADVRSELIDSGVIINTIGFSGDADEPLLSQIAGDTGGIYRFVPTTPSAAGAGALQPGSPQHENMIDEMTALGLTPQQAESIAAASSYLPGPLRLDEVYDYLDTEAQSAARILNSPNATLGTAEWYEQTAYVDESATTLRLVIAGKESHEGLSCGDRYRRSEVQTPSMQGTESWIALNPPDQVPSGWDVRNSPYDDVAIIPQPEAGDWTVRTQYSFVICIGGQEPAAPQGTSGFPVMINASVQSDYRLQGHFLPPFNSSSHAEAGTPATIVGTLLDRNGALPGAIVVAFIERPDGSTFFTLASDDGEHGDGAADDGIYGLTYRRTDAGGTYTVRLFALFDDPANPGETIRRDWVGSFWIDGPEPDHPDNNDQDQDGLPDPWEERCNLDVGRDDSQEDNDDDGLTNAEEWLYGTLPCDPDTDNGGERDGSEVAAGRDPLDPNDDLVPPLGFVNVRGLDSAIRVYWTRPLSYTNMVAVIHSGGQLVDTVNMGQDTPYTIPGLNNGQTYEVIVYGENGAALGTPRGPFIVTPKADSVRPQGSVLINYDAPETAFRFVHLSLDAVDHAVDSSQPAYFIPPEEQFAPEHGEVPHARSVAEMRVTNDLSTFADPDAGWQPYRREIHNWYLSNCIEDMCVVYAQFRDEAGNVSVTVSDEIRLNGEEVTLPLILAP